MQTTSIDDYLTGLATPLREIAEAARPVIDGALADATDVDATLFTDWLRQAHTLEGK